MQRTGMTQTLGLVAAVMIAACGGDDGGTTDDGSVADRPIDSVFDPPIDAPPIDGPVDGPTDASGCGADIRLVGEYFDWDSTLANPIGNGGAQWTVEGDITRTTMSRPSGNVTMCIDPAQPSRISVSGPAGYLPALFLADPSVLSPPGSRFLARGLQMAGPTGAAAQYAEFGVVYNASSAHVLVYNLSSNPISLALEPAINPPQRSFVNGGGFNDTTWSEAVGGNTGKLTLFPNRPFSATPPTLTSTSAFMGPTAIPIAGGRLTIVVIR